jgi:DNA-binding NarL/FixJ family response regulator
MFTYLLLRDNKQSGPYLLEELKVSGIQATDMLWIEGSSVAWRYADEIDELQAFVHASSINMNGVHISSTTLQIDHKEDSDNKRFGNKNEVSPFLPPETKAKLTEETDKENKPVGKRNLEIRKDFFIRKEAAESAPSQPPASEKKENSSDDLPSTKIIKVIIADDHALFREGVKTALAPKKDISIVAEAENGVQLLHQLKHNRPDVILLDIQMPVMDGISALTSIRKQYADMKVIILSMHEGHSMISTLMETGANAYLTKTADPETIYQAIKTCYSKNYYFSELTNVSMLEGLRSKNKIAEKINTSAFDGANLMLKLTAAQKKSSSYSSKKTRNRILFASFSILLIGAGIIAGMSIMGRATQTKRILPPAPKKAASLPVTNNIHQAAPAQIQSADSLQKKNNEKMLQEEKNSALLNGKKDISEKHKHIKATDSFKVPSPAMIQKVDTSANTNNTAPAKQASSAAAELKALARNSIRSLVTASVNDYHKGTFGGLSEIELTVSNKSAYTINEATVEVQYLLSNAKLYKTETLNFQDIASGSSLVLQAPKSSRGAKILYRILSIKCKELEL